MAKYSYEFKKKVVQAYLNGEGGQKFLAKKYGIPADSNVKKWIDNYQEFDHEGLIHSREHKKYSFEKKLSVVELYVSSEISYQELALQEKIYTPSQIAKWVNDFRIAGSDALRPKKKGYRKTLDNSKQKSDTIQDKLSMPVDTNIEHVKELEDELLKLRIENAYLKELRRLRLEEEALLKKQPESSTAFEESSN